jgi:hypothetical protein
MGPYGIFCLALDVALIAILATRHLTHKKQLDALDMIKTPKIKTDELSLFN